MPPTPAPDRALRDAFDRYEAAQGSRDRQELVTARLALCVEDVSGLRGQRWLASGGMSRA